MTHKPSGLVLCVLFCVASLGGVGLGSLALLRVGLLVFAVICRDLLCVAWLCVALLCCLAGGLTPFYHARAGAR